MTRTRLIALTVIVAAIAAFFAFDLDRFLQLAQLQQRQQELLAFVAANRFVAIGTYFLAYVVVTALSIPGAAVMTLLGGALFGVLVGTVVVSFASTAGATLAFLLARFLFRDTVERRFAGTLDRVNRGVDKDGPYYLFTLRLVPLFPFFAINLAMALTSLRVSTFAWVSQLGMLPATVVYVNAGTQLASIADAGNILSPTLLGSLVLLGLFPWLARKLATAVATRRRLQKFRRPRQYDANLVVVGAGAAGLVTAYVAAAAQARVVLIEKRRMGGDCLNTGCVPSKALLRSARVAGYFARAGEFGLRADRAGVDFGRVMQRVRDVVAAIEPHDSAERYAALGVDCIAGEARIETPWSVRVDDRLITTRSIVVATGGTPAIPSIPGLDRIEALTSDTLWQLTELPGRLLVLGGGPLGCEMAQAFSRLGSEVTLVEQSAQLLPREDPAVSAALVQRFEAENIRVLLAHGVDRFTGHGAGGHAVCAAGDAHTEVPFDRLLVATGRRATTRGFGLEELGVELDADGTLAVNEYLQATYPNIYACGDVAGPFQLTHAAGHQGWYCAMNALFGGLWKFRADYSVVPWAVFTDPEVARVGMTEAEARGGGLDIDVTHYGIDDLDRAIADGEAHGFVKVITPVRSDRILGVTIVGPHAADLIAEFVVAMRNGIGLRKILGTIHIYPTLAEANKYAAGEWQRAHLSGRLLRVAKRFNDWQRR